MCGKRNIFFVIVFLTGFSTAECALAVNRLDHDFHEHGENDIELPLPTMACAGCSQLDQPALTDLRLQFVKQLILRKLRLKERPDKALPAAEDLPAPVAAGITLAEDVEKPHEFDDYYGRTDQKIIFPVEKTALCAGSTKYSSACFQFELPPDLEPGDVSRAELWFHKEADKLDDYNQTFVISEAAHWDYQQKFKKTKPIAIHETSLKTGWLRVDLTWSARTWLVRHERAQALHVACRTCAAARAPLSRRARHRPFLVISTKYASKKRRQRQLECAPGVSECCREPLYVSFSELDWDDWIVQPAGYHAYFCRGSCASIAAVAQSGSFHNTVIQDIMYKSKNAEKKMKLEPCCAPTTFSSLQLFYMDSNNTVTQKTLPNMVVESCGCM